MSIKKKHRLLVKEGAWITTGHTFAALGTLAGIRVLTEVASPALFGEFTLAIGVLALVQGLAYQPFGQAVLRYYFECTKQGSEAWLRQFLARTYTRRFSSFAVGIVAVALLLMNFMKISWITVALLLLLFALEGWKSIEIVLANASRRQSVYATLLATDAIARPFASVGAVLVSGPSVEALIAGQCFALILVLLVFYSWHFHNLPSTQVGPIEYRLVSDMVRFARPLLWLPLIGWVGGLADRYIVGGVLGLGAAGIYAAAYGIASRPFLLLGAITDATLRQPLYAAFSNSHSRSGKRMLAFWIAVNMGVGVVGAFLIWWLQKPVTGLLLAGEYRDAADLLPWIALGHVFLVTAQAVERMIYAAGNTRMVIRIQFVSAGVGVLLAYVAAEAMGLNGVAFVVPVYFGLQLLITLFSARRVVIQTTNLQTAPLVKGGI